LWFKKDLKKKIQKKNFLIQSCVKAKKKKGKKKKKKKGRTRIVLTAKNGGT